MKSSTLGIFFAGGFVVGSFIVGKAKWHRLFGFDPLFTGAFPRNSGATSAVTGGAPEDINQMPATLEPEEEGPIYDGSQLPSPTRSA